MRERPANRVPFLTEVYARPEGIPVSDRFPLNLPFVQGFGSLEFHPAVTFFVGENGSGKSTLLEAIAVRAGFPETGGPMDKEAFVRRDLDGGLHDYLRLASTYRRPSDGFFLRAEAFFNLANELDEASLDRPSVLDEYCESLNERSHGEAFLQLIAHRFRWESLFVLDEPEAALSPQRLLTLLKEIDTLVRGGCQFLIATHSPILMAYPDAWIYQLEDGQFHRTAWEDTDHVKTTKAFLSRPEAFLRYLE